MQIAKDYLSPSESGDNWRVLLPEIWAHRTHDSKQREEDKEVRNQHVSGSKEDRAAGRTGGNSGRLFLAERARGG